MTVVVELQARFDEEANIHWAKRLTEAGVHVIFSAPGLKIHAKLFLISRKEGDEVVRYAHIGTGNFNEKPLVSTPTIRSSPPTRASLMKSVACLILSKTLTGQSASTTCWCRRRTRVVCCMK